MDDRQAREESGGSVKWLLYQFWWKVTVFETRITMLHNCKGCWQPCGWNGQTVFSSVIFSYLLDSRYTLVTVYVVNIFSQLVITYFVIQHITVLNFHKVRFVYLLFNCFWVYLSHLRRSPLLQIYKTFFHIFFFQYLDLKKTQNLKWIYKLLWYAKKGRKILV